MGSGRWYPGHAAVVRKWDVVLPLLKGGILEISVLPRARQAISQVHQQVVSGVTRMGTVSDSPEHET